MIVIGSLLLQRGLGTPINAPCSHIESPSRMGFLAEYVPVFVRLSNHFGSYEAPMFTLHSICFLHSSVRVIKYVSHTARLL
jgi:hypothetical protein